jgi:hypothetical protein
MHRPSGRQSTLLFLLVGHAPPIIFGVDFWVAGLDAPHLVLVFFIMKFLVD